MQLKAAGRMAGEARSGMKAGADPVMVHLIDGTYELFRHFYGLRRFNKGKDSPYGAVIGVLRTVLQMVEGGATHLGVATDHVIESFRNDLWPDYKTGAGIERALWSQFHPLEEALDAMGVAVWPMVELEADDALASAAVLASRDPDVVQVDRRTKAIRDENAVREKFGVPPSLIPDYLALVGDTADGYPGLGGIGPTGAARLLTRHGPIEAFPPDVLRDDRRELALRFKQLATLRIDAPLFDAVDDIRWRGPTTRFEEWTEHLQDARLLERARKATPAP